MLVINGALAVFNGLLVATGRIWCECVRGGTCCGGECRCDEGECCDGEWYTDEGYCCAGSWHTAIGSPDNCPEGSGFYRWGQCDTHCCGCIDFNETIPDGEGGAVNVIDNLEGMCCNPPVPFFLPTDSECPVGCCEGGDCTEKPPGECSGTFVCGGCAGVICPIACCSEDSSGIVECDVRACEAPGVPAAGGECGFDAANCLGECCVDGESIGQTSQAQCDESDGCWWGLGSTECGTVGFCRDPFDDDCCENIVSSAQRLTLTGPRKKRCPELERCGVQVTVTVTTGSPVYIHGGQFGNPYEACTDITSFYLCNDEFFVTPAPCAGTLDKLDIEVCWDELESPSEILLFRCCQDVTHLLGNCDCECVTRALYQDAGCTSNAVMRLGGDAVIESSGTGALVLTSAITHAKTCSRTLTLDGTNENDNSVVAMSNPSTPGELSVTKDGSGLWVLTAASTYTGQTLIKNGTLVAAVGAPNNGNGVFGSSNSAIPIIGDTGGTGVVAALLLRSGVAIDRDLAVAASSGGQVVRLGGVHTSGTSVFAVNTEIRLGAGRDIELVANGTGLVQFRNFWLDSDGGANVANNFEVGAFDFGGVVRLRSELATSGSVLVANGRLEIDEDGSLAAEEGLTCQPGTELRIIEGSGADRIDPSTEVLLRGSVLDIGGSSQRIEDLTLEQSATVSDTVGGGLLRLDGSVDVLGIGNEISCDVELVSLTTFDENGSLAIAGDVSGDGIVKNGSGTLTLEGEITYTGQTSITGGTLVIEQDFAGSADISLVTFTPTTLAVAFTTTPVSAATYQILGGSTLQTYGVGAVTLTGAGGATGTYDSATSTLTID